MTCALAALLVVHGLSRLPGFAKAFGLVDLTQPVLPISRAAGVAWLAAGLAFTTAAVALFANPRGCWAPAALGVLLSLALVFASWGDAKLGTVANLILLVPLVVTAFEGAFHARFGQQAAAAVASAGTHSDAPVTEDDLRGLPEPIVRWIRWSGAVGQKRIDVLRLTHGGRFKARASQGWLPIRGEYVITMRRPSFQWYGRMQLAPGVHVAAIGADHARCEVRDAGFTTAADVHVNGDGALDRIEVQPASEFGEGRFTMERFTGKASRPATWGGRQLATHFDGHWNLPEGDLHCVAFEVEQATFG